MIDERNQELMDKRFFEKRCTYSIRKFALGAASVMIGASFLLLLQYWLTHQQLAQQIICQVSWLIWIKKASDNGREFDKEAAAANPGSAESNRWTKN